MWRKIKEFERNTLVIEIENFMDTSSPASNTNV